MKRRLYLIAVLVSISLLYVTQNTVHNLYVHAAEAAKVPTVTAAEKTLYVGYKNYTIKLKNTSKSAAITYKSSNGKVASVSSKGVVKPVAKGTATITVTIGQDGKKYKSKISIVVEEPYFEPEEFEDIFTLGSKHTLKAKVYGMDADRLEWSANDSSVIKIEKKSGVLTAVGVGTTKVVLRDKITDSSWHFPITVKEPYKPPSGSDVAKYISGLDLSKKTGPYYKTNKEECIETTRFVLYLGKGVEVPVNVIELINYIMDMIEDETGYEFYAKEYESLFGMDLELEQYFETAGELKKIDPAHQKVGIVVAANDKHAGPYAHGGSGVLLGPKDIKLQEQTDGAHAIIHELLHVTFYRNGKSMNGVFVEGFATYYTARIIEKDTRLKCTHDSYFNLGNYQFVIDEDTIEQLYIIHEEGSGRYELGFRLMHFIAERYGDNAFKKLHEKVSEKLDDSEYEASTKLIAEVLKEQLSKDFFVEFAKWHKQNREKFRDVDLSVYGDWHIISDRIMSGRLVRYYGDDRHVVIPNSVIIIGHEAFNYCQTMETIEIPDTVTSIHNGAFFGCSNLKEIYIPDSVTKLSVDTFRHCTGLEKVRLSNNITEIPMLIFDGGSSLKEINLPNSIEKIGKHAFAECSSLKNITLPEKLKEIEYSAFRECTSLEKIHIPNSVKSISSQVFSDCINLTDVILPKDLKKIEASTFWNCTSLKSIKIPEEVTEIGENAFNFTNLQKVKIPEKVTKIGDFAFGHCKDLKIEIPASVKSIGKETFYACDNLIIYGKKGSYAEKYAKENNFKFVVK